MSAYASCRSCLAAIIWATTANGKRMPLDRAPDPAGIVAAYCDEFGAWHCKPFQPGDQVAAPWKRYTSHFASCPRADEHRSPRARQSAIR